MNCAPSLPNALKRVGRAVSSALQRTSQCRRRIHSSPVVADSNSFRMHPNVMLQKMWSFPGMILLGVTVGIAALITTTSLIPQQHMHLKTEVPAPTSLNEIINEAPLVFIGQVGPVVAHRTLYGYGPNGEELEASEVPSDAPGMPITEFKLKVERLIKDDGTVASGEPIILLMGGDATPETKELTQDTDYPFSYTGDSYLFLLTPNPDDKTYGFEHGPWSRLLVDNDVLKISNGEEEILSFADDSKPVTLGGFLEQVHEQGETTGPVKQ